MATRFKPIIDNYTAFLLERAAKEFELADQRERELDAEICRLKNKLQAEIIDLELEKGRQHWARRSAALKMCRLIIERATADTQKNVDTTCDVKIVQIKFDKGGKE